MAFRSSSLSILLALIACLACARAVGARVTAEQLDQSLELSRTFLLNAQRPDGSFVYETDAAKGTDAGTRNSTREMGGLWALTQFHRKRPTPETGAAIVKSFKLQDSYARRTADGGRYLTEPAAREWTTNLLALHVLALQEFVATEDSNDKVYREQCKTALAEEIKFLQSLRLGSGRFASTYRTSDGKGVGAPSPFSDGESLLALCRAAKAQGADPALRDVVLESGAMMYTQYVKNALRADANNEDTKGFYQWGSMAFLELYTSEWPGTKPYAARTIVMARWMIDVQQLTRATNNAGHAYEGLAAAWEAARLSNDKKNQQYIGAAIDVGLSKLLTWQIGSPLANDITVPRTFTQHAKAKGGVLGSMGESKIRIDVVQHQTHATMLARKYMFPTQEAAANGR